jgi:diguanylate cyclase (GGDEF)-like protein
VQQRGAALRAALAAAAGVEQACAAATDWLAETGLLVSVYLRQGDRLRCRAVHGYWQIFDGMLGTGVIGATFRTGTRTLVRAATSHPDYLAAAPDVADELCVPLRVHGVVVGVVNAETTTPLTAEQEEEVDLAAVLLSTRLEAFPLPEESSAQKLGRHTAELSTLAATVDGPMLLQAVVRAAVDISGMESAALCLDGGDGVLVVHAACGPFAEHLHTLPLPQLARIAAWVETGTSSYTTGTSDGIGFPGHEELRTYGAGSLAVLPLRTAGTRRGMLLVTTQQIRRLGTEEVQLLELLTATVASCLQIADSVQALRQRAEADALTGLGHHASFHATLSPARRAAAGRLAVLYVDVDHFKSVNDSQGHAAGDQLLLAIADCMRGALRDGDRLFRIGGDEFAALAQVAADEQAVGLGQRLLEVVHEQTGATLSVGVAVEEPGESDATLLARADAAVYAAKAAGRASVRLAPPQPVAVPAPRAVAAGQNRGGSV